MEFNTNNSPKDTFEKLITKLSTEYPYLLSGIELESMPLDIMLDKVFTYYEHIIACMPGNVYWFDNNCRAIGCNDNQLQVFGFSSLSQFKGLTFEEIGAINNWDPEATQKIKSDTIQVIKTGKAQSNIEEPPLTDSNGNLLYYLTSRVPLYDQNKNVIAVVGISIDITDRKLAETKILAAKEKAELANQTKDQLIENMQHDIRTPLGGVLALLKQLADEKSNAHISQTLLYAAASLGQLLNYCNEILEVANINYLGSELNYEVVDSQKFFSQPIDLERASAISKGVDLVLNIDDKIPPLIKVDKIRVEKIIINLIGNALKFTEKGAVTLSVKLLNQDENQITLKIDVTDTGIGIEKDKINLIFDKFVKLHPSNRGIYKGTGLGLYYVKKFIEDMQGQVDVTSEPGKGTTFSLTLSFPLPLPDEKPIYHKHEIDTSVFSLPVAHQQINLNASTEVYTDTEFQKSERPNILLIEDDEIVRITVVSTLKGMQATMFVAVDVKSGKEAILKQTYDLVISDLGLPDGTGFDIIDWARSDKTHPNQLTPFIVLTANNSPEKKDIALSKGFLDVFQKPLMIDSAKKMLETYCHKKTKTELEIIDMEKTCEIIHNTEEVALTLFEVLLKSLQEEKKNLVTACIANDVTKTRDILHKLKGSLSYVSVKALQHARDELHAAVKNTDHLNKIIKEYNQFFGEIVKFENELGKLKDK